MRAMQLHQSQAGPTFVLAEVPQPTPGKGDVLIRVHAAGVTTTELGWSPSTQTSSGKPRLNAIPASTSSPVSWPPQSEGVDSVVIGDLVYGMNDWFADGATAEFCLTQPLSIAPKPTTLTNIEAATVPIGALTAWQGLFDRAKLQPNERVLVHGGTGGVGIFAVQLAARHGAHVIATTSAQHASLAQQLGANEVIDYKTVRFEDQLRGIDIVFDTVGGETRERSWSVLKPNGRMISITVTAMTPISQLPAARELHLFHRRAEPPAAHRRSQTRRRRIIEDLRQRNRSPRGLRRSLHKVTPARTRLR